MGDYGFGLLQTANVSNSNAVFGGSAFRSYLAGPSSNSSPPQFPSVSPTGFSSVSNNASVSSLFLSAAAAHHQNMQDELLGVTTPQQPAEKLNSSGSSSTTTTTTTTTNSSSSKPGHQQPPQLNNHPTDFKPAVVVNSHQDFSKHQLNQKRKEFGHLSQQDFKQISPEKFGQQQLNVQQELKKQQQFSQSQEYKQPQQPGDFSHLNQQYQVLNRQNSPKSEQNGDRGLESPHQIGTAGAEDRAGEANAALSPSTVNLQNNNKSKIQMESPTNHLIGSSSNTILQGGLGAGFNSLQSQEIPNPPTSGGSVSPSLPGFGAPWSVQTSPPPPPISSSTNLNSSQMNQIPNPEPENSFYPGIPSSINPAFFQSFSPVSPNPCAGINVPGFNSPFSQINLPQQQNRRSPVSPQLHHQHQAAFLQQRNSYNHHQDRTRMYDTLNMHSLENSLIDIMRAEHDPLKGRMGYPHPGTDNLLMLNARSYGRRRGRSSLFPIDDGLLDDGHSDQVVSGVLNSPNCYPHQNGERIERFSRKVFVGGLPPDIDEDEITASFRRFGPLVVDWPHKAESKSYFPPKGYAFLLFQEESSVQALIDACIEEDGKLYLCVSSPTIKDKPVQIRPWNLSDSDFVMDGSQPLDPRKTIFVGGVPRPLRAVELAMIMDRLYGGVCYAGIDTDPELKYPKGAGRVAFSNQQSYIAAISARFVQLQHGDIDKRVEVKPYVLDDQMCDECQGARCGGKFAPFFCANVTCLQYYCEFCWANIHSRAGREFHKPLVKEGADRPRQIHFRWN
ncbi:cytoplasmic polyadenylation element-binding protein 3 isoform X2 [Latimeria chalumnae]|uniref:cytoplasmic polyadenylation element-binding protein 3 isoform X2 n=1 Tax=Latimeria chalumnae TaxID=7897 RepID=UPI0003C1469B|nr:PREDICTED: cytoplasmic polyadenylation element-binding protein 2 isoform X3 [Latimeria chalumnae]|eukprot:XP_006002241.1 PREDICTED: cytoplasmic polyadenylation element-binding protein 2 isoform X3 [Latimeria chalumnae]